MSEQGDTVVHRVKNFLKESSYAELRTFCLCKENQEGVSESGWDVLTMLVKHLKDTMVAEPDQFNVQDVFNHIANISNAKELLLGILEQFDPMEVLEIVEMLLPPLQIVVKKLMHSDKKHHCYNLSMVFSSLIYYCESLNTPNYENFDPIEEQKEILEELKIARFVEKCSQLVTSVLTIARGQFSDNLIHRIHLSAIEQEIMLFLCSLMERLSLLNVIHDEENQTESYQVERASHSVTNLILKLHSAWDLWHERNWKVFIPDDRRMTKEEDKKIANARGLVLYMLCCNLHLSNQLAQVMNVQFAFICAIPSILALFESTNSTVVHKGLALCRHVSNRLEPLSLECSYMNEELKSVPIQHPAKKLLEAAVAVAVHNPVKTLRQRAAQFLTKLVDKFIWNDRFNLFYHLIITVEHSGVVGYMTVYYKDKLSEILKDDPPVGSEVFLKPSYFDKIIDACLALPLGSETDLLSEYDRLMASLNLLRFLFLRDTENKTGIWDKVTRIENEFLNLLRTDINLSRMHFRDEMKKQSLPSKEQGPMPQFTVNGVNLPSVPPEHRVQMLQSAVHGFDMMQAVCVRLQEIMDKKP